MKISGFTFCKNVVKFEFPVIEAISSVLPFVDEFIINVGQSEDDTLDVIRSIKDHRVRVIESVWDETLKQDGKVFGIQQNIALSHCTGDWAFLVQADEVIHEDDWPIIKKAMEDSWDNPRVLGLVFQMLHFKGDYWSVDPWMYRRATRVIRNHCGIQSTTDCCDFREANSQRMIKSGANGCRIKARVFHYGYVRPSHVLQKKLEYQYSRHNGEMVPPEEIASQSRFLSQIPNYDLLKPFHGTHPKVMEPRLMKATRLRRRSNRWLNWRFYREIIRHGFKG